MPRHLPTAEANFERYNGTMRDENDPYRFSNGTNLNYWVIMFYQKWDTTIRSSRPEVFCKKTYSQKFCRAQACNVIKKESLAQVFSCEFFEISKNNFFYRTRPVAGFMYNYMQLNVQLCKYNYESKIYLHLFSSSLC